MRRTVPVTVVVPTLDGGSLFLRQLAALQAADPAPERVLVVDSSSTDGSAEAAAAAGCDVVRIPRESFDHGVTRRQAVELCTTEFVAFLSQDAVPESDWLAGLMDPFSDPNVAGARARILPLPESSPLAARTVRASSAASPEQQIVSVDPAAFERLPGAQRKALCLFDNVASLARREVLLRHPFPRTMMGEDIAFAESVLRAGRALAHAPRAVVRHAHEYGFATAYARYREDARHAARTFGIRTRRGLFDVLRGFVYEVREDVAYLQRERPRGRARALLRSPFLRLGQVLGQWRGSRPESHP